MYKYRNRRLNKDKFEKEQQKSTQNKEEIKKEINRPNLKNYETVPNQRNVFKRNFENDKDSNQNESLDMKNKYINTDKNSLSNNINKAKSRPIKNDIETSEFETTNPKLRNTMNSLNNDRMKYESGLIDIILKVEKDNVNHYLKGDLAQLYHEINNDNYDFKNNVFLANVNNFEKKTGILDKRPVIPYNCSEDISFKLDKFPRTNEIIDKFTEKTKTFTNFE